MPEAPLVFTVAIPARYASTRLPGKPLRLLAGRPLLEHVYRRAIASGAAQVVIATDDVRIAELATKLGAAVCMTAPDHASGTDRLAEVASTLAWAADTIVVNVQGDEPHLPTALIQQVAAGLAAHPTADIATLCTRIHNVDELFNPNVVKVTRDACNYALYFSRAAIPWHRDGFAAHPETLSALPSDGAWFRHIGLYAYRVATLLRYPQWASAPAEQAESLEQLRALWYGARIYVAEALEVPAPGVDTEADLQRAEAYYLSKTAPDQVTAAPTAHPR